MIQVGYLMTRVRYTDKRYMFVVPEVLECLSLVWSDSDNFSIVFNEFLVVLAQLRHVMATVWSTEASIKDEYNVFLSLVIGKAYLFALSIG